MLADVVTWDGGAYVVGAGKRVIAICDRGANFVAVPLEAAIPRAAIDGRVQTTAVHAGINGTGIGVAAGHRGPQLPPRREGRTMSATLKIEDLGIRFEFVNLGGGFGRRGAQGVPHGDGQGVAQRATDGGTIPRASRFW